MKALRNHASRPAAAALVADDVLELHAGRLVLLLSVCGGTTGAINGLTKMAKLDFFVRYPDFFDIVRNKDAPAIEPRAQAVEAAMVRHHYGPWDKRYYHVLAYLESRGLITVKKSGKSFRIALTKIGKTAAGKLANAPSFERLRKHMEDVSAELSAKTGNELKTMIYSTFEQDVGKRPLGQVISRGE